MRRFLGALAALALLASGAGQARAGNILYFVDLNIGTDQMAAALAALSPPNAVTVATSPLDFAAKIATPGAYDLGVFSQQLYADFANPYTNGADYSTALSALSAFVAGGGKAIVNTWSPDGFNYVSAFGADYTGNTNDGALTLSAFDAGVVSPVSLTNPTSAAFPTGYGTYATGQSLSAVGSAVAATFTTSGDGAIIVGNSGRSIVNGFLNDTAGDSGERVYINEIDSLLPPVGEVPEPATLTMLGFGIAGMIGYARARRRKEAVAA